MRNAIIAGLAGLALTAGIAATPASAATVTAKPRAAVTQVHPDFEAGKNAAHCSWRARGRHEFITYAYLRMIKDTCADWVVRIRIAGKCSVAGWRDGNWINDVHQLTSISCPAGQGYLTIVLDYQYYWPASRHARHGHPRGRVHQIFLQ